MGKKPPLTPKDRERQEYQALAQERAPGRPILGNLVRAFLVGGAISLGGQLVFSYLAGRGIEEKQAQSLTSAAFVFLGALFTGLGLYDELGRLGGMGSALPISGFANSIAAAAMEYKREGWVLGVGARMFIIAGPVIVYGLLTAVTVAAVRYLLKGQVG